jgi:hypothetical protein
VEVRVGSALALRERRMIESPLRAHALLGRQTACSGLHGETSIVSRPAAVNANVIILTENRPRRLSRCLRALGDAQAGLLALTISGSLYDSGNDRSRRHA